MKKILILVVILLLIGVFAYPYLKKFQNKSTDILGIKDYSKSIKNINSSSEQIDTNDILSRVKESISNIDPNAASSSSQIQKIIDDLKSLQEKKDQPMEVICDAVCKK